MRSLFVLLLALGAFSFSVHAKENKDLMKADYYYGHFDFHEAIPYYEKVAVQLNDVAIYSRLGDCYRLTGNLQSAADWYAKAAKMQSCSATVLLHYGQVMMQLTQYEDAEKVLKKYLSANQNDKRAQNLIAGCETALLHTFQDIPTGTATLLGMNTDGSEFAPTLWKGNLVFTSDTVINIKKKKDNWTGDAYYSIYSVSCDKKLVCGTQYSMVAAGNDVNTKFHNGPCTFSADGRRMYFTRSKSKNSFFSKQAVANSDSVVLLEIMIASDYDAAKKQFKKVTPFQYNSNDHSVADPTVSPDGNMLVFSSNMPGGWGGSDLYLCMKKNATQWSQPVNLGRNFNTEGEELFPYWADNNTLYFSSDGHVGLGGLDVYRCIWDAHKHTFSKPENLGVPINSSYDDISLALSADEKTAFFSSNRPATKKGDNIYFYKRQQVYLILKVIDSLTRTPLTSVRLKVDATPAAPVLYDTVVDGRGWFASQLYTGVSYNIQLRKDGYDPAGVTISTAFNILDVDTIVHIVVMTKIHVMAAVPKLAPPVRFTDIVGTPEVNKVYDIGQVPFNYDKYNIIPSAKPCLDSLADFLKKNSSIGIEVRAHTDCRENTPGYNLILSSRRAKSVVDYLQKKGIAPARLTANGLGSTDPRVKCPICEKCTEADHYQNRIMDFKVLKRG